MNCQYSTNNELYHHGILGMKWGVRRFQNKDGSLTPAGKKRQKEARKQLSQEAEEKIKKAARIGTIIAGPLGGVIAGSIASKKVNSIDKKSMDKGKNKVDKFKDTKIETDEQRIKRLMKEGKISDKANYTFDQNGNLFMVTWND